MVFSVPEMETLYVKPFFVKLICIDELPDDVYVLLPNVALADEKPSFTTESRFLATVCSETAIFVISSSALCKLLNGIVGTNVLSPMPPVTPTVTALSCLSTPAAVMRSGLYPRNLPWGRSTVFPSSPTTGIISLIALPCMSTVRPFIVMLTDGRPFFMISAILS